MKLFGRLSRPARPSFAVNPAEQLKGLVLVNGWRVKKKHTPSTGATGGTFSVGYVVEGPSGERGFLKAFDFFSRISDWADPARELPPLLDAYNFERDLLALCNGKRLKRVVRALDSGAVTVSTDPQLGAVCVVQYLIFELAEGDVRKQLDFTNRFDLAWATRALHHIAGGLNQLHRLGAVHQDLKPSNVLMFEKRTSNKISDLGRAAVRGQSSPHYDQSPAGDPEYAPPEYWYGEQPADWHSRRAGCDAYLLGSMIVFFFSQTSMTALLKAFLEPQFRPDSWGDSYPQLLPHLYHAFEQALDAFSKQVPPQLRSEIVEMVRQLCDPDPSNRGHPLDRRMLGNKSSLERYVSKFDLLASKLETGMLRAS